MAVRVLVCEDDLVSMKIIEKILVDEKYEVVPAKDGFEAIRNIDKGEFDLIITDIHMPYHSGDEILKRVRSSSSGSIPVIMLSADTQEEVIALAYREGVNDFIKKPVKRDELLKKIRKLLKSK
jgi:CheY-like chemotaxis protein